MSSSTPTYTVFISHAGEDKSTIAIPLRNMLNQHGISAFVDEEDMPVGTEAKKAMTAAMESAQVGVVVLSPEFVARTWPMKELMCFLRRREETSQALESLPVIIPFFYRLRIDELYGEPRLERVDNSGQSLYLKSRFFERRDAGEPEAQIELIRSALRKLHGTMGVRNEVDATNDNSLLMNRRRQILLDNLYTEICRSVDALMPGR